jgi:hypothetical protein
MIKSKKMENYPKRLDEFIVFAKEKLDARTAILNLEAAKIHGGVAKNEVCYLHKQKYEMELSAKILELNRPDGILWKPLTMLKDYYVEIFERSIFKV